MTDEDPAVREWREAMTRRPTPEVADQEESDE